MSEKIIVRVDFGSKSSNGKWGYRAITDIKAAGGTYDAATKTWALPADADLSPKTWTNLSVVPS